MKKVLFATTALIATAGVASADVTLTGSAQIGLAYQEGTATSTNNTTVVQREVGLGVSMSGSTDALDFGASFAIDGDAGSNADALVYISGEFGKIAVGAEAADTNEVIGIADLGFDGTALDDVVEDIQELNGTFASDVAWTYAANGLTIGVSAEMGGTSTNATTTTASTTPYGVGITYTTGAITVGYGFTDADNTAGDDASAFALTYKAGDLTLNAGVATMTVSNVDTQATGLSVAYAMDADTTITAIYADRDTAGWKGSYGLNIGYNLGGGATLQAGVASVDDGMYSGYTGNVSSAQVGLKLAF